MWWEEEEEGRDYWEYKVEKNVFREITTGTSNELETASESARSIVKVFGRSDKLGPVTFGEKERIPFMGANMDGDNNYSEETALVIDKEVAKLIEDARKVAQNILKQKRKTLDKIAKVLIEKETIERQEFEQLVGINGKAIKK